MSILLVDPPATLGEGVVRKLEAQDDEVRVVTAAPGRWRDLGAHVAIGDPTDADLLERAGQHARTLVLFEPRSAELTAAVEAMGAAGIERLVVCARRPLPDPLDISRVTLLIPKGLFKKGISDDRIADAINAADDMADVRDLQLDLGTAEGWEALGLDAT